MSYLLTKAASNRKTGPMPIVTAPASTCPSTCSLRNGGGCYAEHGPLSLVWRRAGRSEDNWAELLDFVRSIPKGRLWRYGQAGDLPGKGLRIDQPRLLDLARASVGKPALCYTHKPVMAEQYDCRSGMSRYDFAKVTAANRQALRAAAKLGFRANISCESVAQAQKAKQLGFQAVIVRARGFTGPERMPGAGGGLIVLCPHTTGKVADCIDCKGLCARERSAVIAFVAHGSGAKRAEQATILFGGNDETT